MTLIVAGDYEAIRKALDTSLDNRLLPDAVIGLDLYAGAASRAVLARDPDAATRTGTAGQQIKLAAILWCASLIAPALPQISGEDHGDDSYRRVLASPEKLAADLRARAEAELAAVLLPDAPTPYRPPVFTLARGRRGR